MLLCTPIHRSLLSFAEPPYQSIPFPHRFILLLDVLGEGVLGVLLGPVRLVLRAVTLALFV